MSCKCRPADRWCRIAKRLRNQMRLAMDDYRANLDRDALEAARALRAYSMAERMLRGHLARLSEAA